MKKLLLTIFLTSTVNAMARENITITYAWGPGDSVANYHRTIALEANKLQEKYNFIVEYKPGAGGAIATNHVLKENKNVILAHSTAFFIRPVVFPNESYDLTQFKSQYVHCTAPMAVTSSKYKTWAEVPLDKSITVGVSGLGVTTHLAALQLQEKFPQINIIPFKSTTDSMLSMVGGQTDFHIGFISESEQWLKDNKGRTVNILGITGTKTIKGYQPLINFGFPQTFAQMNVGHHLLVPKTQDEARTKELYDILRNAAQKESVKNAYAVDYCEPSIISLSELNKWFSTMTDYWKKLALLVKL